MRLFTLLFLVCCTIGLNAQESAIAKIHYLFKHINDTLQPEKYQKDHVVTYLATNSSYYSSFSEYLMKEQIHSKMALPDFEDHLTLSINTSPVLTGFYFNWVDRKAFQVEGITSTMDSYSFPINYEVPEWELFDDVKEIAGYSCQKAKARVKGRLYTAWFTSELPFSSGPWRLHGLPGLILAAQDESGTVSFEYEGFDKVEPSVYEVSVPDYTLPASQMEVDRLRKAFKDNPSAYYSVLQSSGRQAKMNQFYGIDYSKTSIDLSFDGYSPSKESNNPIEK